MVDLEFMIESVEVEKYSATPLLRFALHVVNNSAAVSIKNILLILPNSHRTGAPRLRRR